MQWYLFALISPFLWAISNHTDKYILSRYFKNTSTTVLIIFSGLVGLVFSFLIFLIPHSNVWGISLVHAVIIILDGALYIVAFIPYYYALKEEDASSVVPLYQAIPVFSFILGLLIFHESIGLKQIIAGLLIIAGSIFITIDLRKTKFYIKKKILFLMLLSSFLLSIYYFIFKNIALKESFWRTAFWEYFGGILVSVCLLLFVKNYRKQFVSVFKENPISIVLINMFNEGINIIAGLSANFATLLVPVVMVNLVNGVQPLFVFLIGIILTLFFPSISKEGITKQQLTQKIIAIIILLFGTYLLVI